MISLPPLPQVPDHGRGRLEVDIRHSAPVLVDTKLGNIPRDYHSFSSHRDRYYTSCDGGRCLSGGREVWRPLPVVASDGKPRMQDVTTRLVASPHSLPGYMLGYGAVGGVLGGLVGAVVGLFAGSAAVGASVGAGVGALVGGTAGFGKAYGDRVRLEWQEKPIEDLRLAGYYHDVDERTREECHYSNGRRHCHTVNDGYDHEFRPHLEATRLGTYWEPAVVHYREG